MTVFEFTDGTYSAAEAVAGGHLSYGDHAIVVPGAREANVSKADFLSG